MCRAALASILLLVGLLETQIAAAQGLSTSDFQNRLSTCAAGLNLNFSADLIGSVVDIYEGDKTQGTANLKTAGSFLELLPEDQRLEGYRLYLSCIKDLVGSSASKTLTRIVEEWSGWKKGGYNQNAWCNDVRSRFENAVGRPVAWQVMKKDERKKEEFYRQFYYSYYCKAEATWDE